VAVSWGDGNDPFGRSPDPFTQRAKEKAEVKRAATENSKPAVLRPPPPVSLATRSSSSSSSAATAADPFAAGAVPGTKKKAHKAASSLSATDPTQAPVKEKKKHKWVPTKLMSKSKSPQPQTSPGIANKPAQPAAARFRRQQDELRMASEESVRAEEERRRRLALQEEQDLAYAIALSKAEAASLKQT
jgi:hypothetical protein